MFHYSFSNCCVDTMFFKTREYLMFCVMVTVLTGMISCSGEMTDRSRNIKTITESDYLTLKLRITEQDVKIEKLFNKILSQNVKISEQDSKIVELQKQVLERLIDQMTTEHNFNESLNQEIEQRKEMNKIQEQFILDMSVNVSQCMLKSEEAIERNKEVNRTEDRRISTVSNRTSNVQEFIKEQTEILLRLNKTESDLMLIKTEQDKKYPEIDTCISEQRRLSSDIQTLENRTDELRIHLDSLREKKENMTFRETSAGSDKLAENSTTKPIPKDCQEILQDGGSYGDGVYDIQPSGVNNSIQVYCDMTTDGGGWTVFQHRFDGSVDFYRTWSEYKSGFGNVHSEFWLGNDNIYRISAQDQYKLRIKMEDFSGKRGFAEYSSFVLSNENDKYRLSIGSYSGTAGFDALVYHNKMKFTTKDADNDVLDYNNCASNYKGAWWYRDCYASNLNGLYRNSKTSNDQYNRWNYFYSGTTNMKSTTMMIRKV